MKKLLSLAFIGSIMLANTLDSSLKNGTFKGDMGLYYERYFNKNTLDSSYAMYSVGLHYKSRKFNNFQLNLGFRANDKIYELYNGDYDNTTKAIMDTANLTYFGNNFNIVIGRKKEMLQWIHGFQEEIKLNFYPSQTYNIELLHTCRHARANNYEELKSFRKINGDDGLNVFTLETKFNNIKTQVYFYNAPSLANWYGTTINMQKQRYSLKLIYSKSNELTQKPNGGYFNIESSFNYKTASLTAGYIQTDKNGGLGSMTISRNVYDSMNPLEEGDHIFEKDAKTFYLNSSYDLNDKLSLALNLGHIKFQNNNANEIDLYADYSFKKNFALHLCLDKYDSDINTDDSMAFKTQLTYKF
jgi:hypothetical protein